MRPADCVPLVEVTRGSVVESIHFGAFLVIDSHGRTIASAGNPGLVTYPRSSMKPFQALPFVMRHGPQKFGLTQEEMAIMCASHTGTDAHRDVLISLQRKLGISESDLQCGVHWPVDAKTRQVMKAAGEQPTENRHNCSGKHTGMLAHVCLRGLEKEDYLNPNHPIQVTIRETLAEMLGLSPESLPMGVDGCSAPVYAIPMKNMAQAVALLADPWNLARDRAEACRKITAAMMTYPQMVAGPGKFDTRLMSEAEGKVFAKGGAEGYQIIGVMPGILNKEAPGLGIAIKISDGDRRGQARAAVSMAILHGLGILDAHVLADLAEFVDPPVKNWRELIVGQIHSLVSLDMSQEG